MAPAAACAEAAKEEPSNRLTCSTMCVSIQNFSWQAELSRPWLAALHSTLHERKSKGASTWLIWKQAITARRCSICCIGILFVLNSSAAGQGRAQAPEPQLWQRSTFVALLLCLFLLVALFRCCCLWSICRK